MSVSNSVRALLRLCGKRQSDLVGVLQMSSAASVNNKFLNGRWSAVDLVDVAAACGCRLAFIMPDGQQIRITADPPAAPAPGAAAADTPTGGGKAPGSVSG